MDQATVVILAGLIITMIILDRRVRRHFHHNAIQTIVPSRTLESETTRFTLFCGLLCSTGPVTITVYTHCVCKPGSTLRLCLHGTQEKTLVFESVNCESPTFTVDAAVDTVAVYGQTISLSVATDQTPCLLSDIAIVMCPAMH